MDDFDNILKFEHPKWKASLVENLTVLFQAGELCDLYILCKDQKDLNVTYPCHACILASASPVVRNVLLKNDVFGSWTKMALESVGISAREWRYILKYVYTGSVSIQEPHIYAVWKAALFLQIEILVTVLATCIHKYHTKEMELNSPVPELKVCPCNISSMGSVFVKSPAETMHSPSGIQNANPAMIQFFPHQVERRDKELGKELGKVSKVSISDEDISRKRMASVTEQDHSCSQTGVIDLTQPSPDKSEMKYSPEMPQECSSRKKRKMYTPRKVEAKQTNTTEQASYSQCHTSLLASVLESPLDNSALFGNTHGRNLESHELLHNLGKEQPLVPILKDRYTLQDPTHKGGQLRSYNLATKVPQNRPHSSIHKETQHGTVLGSVYQEKESNKEIKNSTNPMPDRFVSRTSGHVDGNKRNDSFPFSSESAYTGANPLVIQPLMDEEHPVMNLSLRDRLQSKNTKNTNSDRLEFGRGQPSVLLSHLTDKPLLSNLLRGSSDHGKPQKTGNCTKKDTTAEVDTSISSVLKSLLTSNDNLYRSPNKSVGQRPELNIPKRQEKKFPQFHDSSEEDIIFDLGVTDNVEADPDYKPKKGKQSRRKTKIMERSVEKSPARQNNSNSGQAQSSIEPYSASSILLSMIRDAETKKVGHSPQSMEPSGTATSGEKDIGSSRAKHVILQQPEMRPKAVNQSVPAETKGILRNLLNHKKMDETSSQTRECTPEPAGKPTESASKSPPPLKVPKPSRKSLPFSHVLKNLASAYSAQDATPSELKKNRTTKSSSASGSSGSPLSALYDKSDDKSGITNAINDQDLRNGEHDFPGDGVKNQERVMDAINNCIEDLTTDQEASSGLNWDAGNEIRSDSNDSATASGQKLKLTICKQGQDFKVKEEPESPECIETYTEDSNTSTENGLEINENVLSVDSIDETNSLGVEENFKFENHDTSGSFSGQQAVNESNAEAADRVSLSGSESGHDEQTNEEDIQYLDFDNDSNQEKSSKEDDCVNCDDSEQEKSDTEKESSVNQDDTEHVESDTEDKNCFTVQSHVFPDMQSADSFAKPSSPDTPTLRIKSYFSIAKPHIDIDGGYTIVEDGNKDGGVDMARFTSLFEKDCASSVSESCSDTEVA